MCAFPLTFLHYFISSFSFTCSSFLIFYYCYFIITINFYVIEDWIVKFVFYWNSKTARWLLFEYSILFLIGVSKFQSLMSLTLPMAVYLSQTYFEFTPFPTRSFSFMCACVSMASTFFVPDISSNSPHLKCFVSCRCNLFVYSPIMILWSPKQVTVWRERPHVGRLNVRVGKLELCFCAFQWLGCQ